MGVLVKLKNTATGEVTEHFSVDATDILAQGEHVQVAGPTVRIAASAKPQIEPGPPVAASVAPQEPPPPPAPTTPHMTHKGGGKWEVFNADGTLASENPLTKAEAAALLETLK